ncbi:MAG: LL-diaminopimelate aminotransferase [Pseudomonadota bacterium]
MSEEEFHRIRRLPPYVFEEVNRLKRAARAAGRDVIDLGMGNPDMPTPPHIVAKLIETVQKPRTHGYSQSRGIPGLRKAMARYYERRFGVKLDPDTEIVATLGSKEAFANLAQAVTAPGDMVIAPNPAYPIHAYGFIIAGGAILPVAAPSPEAYLSKVGAVLAGGVRPKVLVLNYPSNPTAQTVGVDFYKDAVALARKHDLMIFSDLAYAEIYFGDPPPSILEAEGAKEIAVEVNSLSKSYAMAGWRVGMAVGNPRMIAALARVKSYLDYGAFTPIQVAAVAALDSPDEVVEDMRAIYRERRAALLESFARAGWEIPAPDASMFCWAPLPPGFENLGSLEFSKRLLEAADVAVAPGVGFGEGGDGFVRIGLVENVARLRQAARNIRKLMDERRAA